MDTSEGSDVLTQHVRISGSRKPTAEPLMWEIVGGGWKGIVAREGQDLKAPALGERLRSGATVEQLDLIGPRLHYRLVSGSGPQEGWVSTTVKDQVLARRMDVDVESGKAVGSPKAAESSRDTVESSKNTAMSVAPIGVQSHDAPSGSDADADKSHSEASDIKLVQKGSDTEWRRDPMSALQVKLRTNKRFKQIVGYVTLMVVFVDILGTALVLPVLGPLCAYAEGGPVDTIKEMPPDQIQAALDELIHPDAFKDPKPPFKFSLAMNAVMSFGQLGSALGSLLMGYLCDKIGCKIPLQICVFNGIIGYFIIYAAGKWVNSYYLFAFGMFWNNFFGNTMGVAVVYIRTIFEEGPEREAFAGGVLALGLVGGAVGALVAMPFVTQPKNGENFFNAIWLAIGLTAIMFLVLSFVIVPSPKPTEEEVQKKKEMGNEKTPALAQRIMVFTIIASALDSAGDEGTRMARGTILSNVFPEWSTTERQNYLLLAMIVVIIFALILMAMMRKCLNLASICTIGCGFTLATQVVLIIEWNVAPFLIFWHLGKLFGFLSTLASTFIIAETAPASLLGQWNGRNEALTNLAAGIAPLIFAPIYDSVGNKRGQEMLATTAGVSLLATLAYMPIISMMPSPQKKEKDEDELKDLSEYEKMTDLEYSHLPMEVIDKVTEMTIEQGKAPRLVSWGDYKEERPLLAGMQHRMANDFKYYDRQMTNLLTSRELMAQEQQLMGKMQDFMPTDREKAKDEMGAWIANYFDDAGYPYWESQCTLYKSMLMNAFPPIDPLDGEKPDYANLSLERLEESLTQFLGTLHSHIASNKKRAHSAAAGSLVSVVRRR